MANDSISKSKQKLAELHGQVLAKFLEEADPKKWPDMSTAGNRGDRYWIKKNANVTGVLLQRIEALFYGHALNADEGLEDEAELLESVRVAEKEAERLGQESLVRLAKRGSLHHAGPILKSVK